MAAFQTSSKWLKLSFLEIHLALFLFSFPLAAIGSSISTGSAAILTITGLFLICSCVLTFSWVFVREIYNNRLIHLGVLCSDFLVAIFCIASAIVLWNSNAYPQKDNVIEAAIGTAILVIVAGLFALTEMKNFRIGFPKTKQKDANTDQKAKENQTEEKTTETKPETEIKPSVKTEKTVNGPFFKNSMWLKYAFYLFTVSMFLNFLPTEPIMYEGTRELMPLVYFCSVLAVTFLFCWIFIGSLRKNKAFHILSAIFIFLTAIFSMILMIIWAVRYRVHHFTPIFLFAGGILASLAGAAVILEIRHQKLSPKTRYLDRECAASCFNNVIRVFRIPGINVVVENESDINGDIGEKYTPQGMETPETPQQIVHDPQSLDPPRETIMSVDNADTKSSKIDKDLKNMRKSVHSDVRDLERHSGDLIHDGYNSPRKIPVAPPFPNDDIIETNRSEAPVENKRISNTITEIGDQASDKIERKIEENVKRSEKEIGGLTRNQKIIGMNSKDKLPVVSGMQNEVVKSHDHFDEQD